jgi:hypothetical protein
MYILIKKSKNIHKVHVVCPITSVIHYYVVLQTTLREDMRNITVLKSDN